MLSELFAAIDVGTTNTKVAVFDEDGSRVCLRQVRCSAVVKNGIHEVNPENWWRAVMKAFLDIDEQIRDRICSMSITGQGPTIVAIDENGSPHGHAITWLDKRKSELPDDLKEEDNSIDEQERSVLLKLQWLKEHIDRRVFLLQPSDFLQLKLTGSLINATFPIEGFLPWRKDTIERFHLDTHFMLPPVVEPGSVVGNLTQEASEVLGLHRTVYVVAGAPDFAMALIGTGILKDGYLCDRGGTSQGVTLCSRSCIKTCGLMTTPFFVPNLWKISGVMSTTGKAYEWFVHRVRQLESRSRNLQQLNQIRRPTKIVFLPYLNGERSPHWDSKARGVFWGLSVEDSFETMLISVMEGVSFGIRDLIDRMEKSGAAVKKIRTTGGQATNDLWNQIKADVLGKEIEVPATLESELLGTAILCISVFKNEHYLETAEKLVKIDKTIKPDESKYETYSTLFGVYRELYRRGIDLFQRIF